MATPENALTTSVAADVTPTAEGALTPASTLASDTGVAQVAQTALDQASGQLGAVTDPIAQALAGIPADDNDLTTIADQTQQQRFRDLRGQLRVLGDAVRELQPLRVYQQYGDPRAVESRLNLAKLLYSPVMQNGRPVRDPNTQTTRITTKPFVDYLDRTSPGLPEQLLVDLLALETENERGVKEPLINQVFSFYKLDFNRLTEYQTIDARIARTSGTVTPEELAEIPTQYHAAYRSIPPSIRAAWASYDKADQDRMLEDYKARLEADAREQRRAEEDQRREAADRAAYANLVATRQAEYFAEVRQDRANSLIQSLAQQVTFSTDPNTNKVLIGSLAATMSQLLDRDWRFVVEQSVLAPLNLKLDRRFDEALDKFESSAAESVALELSGNTDRARDTRDDSVSAANQLMAQIAIFALKVAKAQGATVVEKAAVQAANLAAAQQVQPRLGTAQVAGTNGRLLPDNMRPGSDEAATYLARQTGLFREATS